MTSFAHNWSFYTQQATLYEVGKKHNRNLFYTSIMLSILKSRVRTNRMAFLSTPSRCAIKSEPANRSLVDDLKTFFNKKMIREKVPLLNSFDKYLESLPVRNIGNEIMVLYNQPQYYVPEDLEAMAKKINMRTTGKSRDLVKYIAAPSGSGKTSCILPAFLQSTNFTDSPPTHYLYLAFENNCGKDFRSQLPSNNPDIAYDQGASFIVKCVQHLLECKPYGRVKLDESVRSAYESEVYLIKYLKEQLGADNRVWFHVDEHFKMCDTDHVCAGKFSRGAMELLAKCGVVIATYTDRPLSIDPEESSSVCRIPVAKPPLDINQVIANIPQLAMNRSDLKTNAAVQRMVATLKFRLGYKIMKIGLAPVLHLKTKTNEANEFLAAFQTAMNHSDVEVALKSCIELCATSIEPILTDERDAVTFLLGFEDGNRNFNRRIDGVISLPISGRLSVSVDKQVVDLSSQLYL